MSPQPNLFIMVLTVLSEAVDWDLLRRGTATNTWSTNRPMYDLEYAADTLLIALTTTQLQSMLQALEMQATLYGMKLNHTKTELLRNPKLHTNGLLSERPPSSDRNAIKISRIYDLVGELLLGSSKAQGSFSRGRLKNFGWYGIVVHLTEENSTFCSRSLSPFWSTV